MFEEGAASKSPRRRVVVMLMLMLLLSLVEGQHTLAIAASGNRTESTAAGRASF